MEFPFSSPKILKFVEDRKSKIFYLNIRCSAPWILSSKVTASLATSTQATANLQTFPCPIATLRSAKSTMPCILDSYTAMCGLAASYCCSLTIIYCISYRSFLIAGPDVVTKRGTATPTYSPTAAPSHPVSLLAQLTRSIQKFRTLLAEI